MWKKLAVQVARSHNKMRQQRSNVEVVTLSSDSESDEPLPDQGGLVVSRYTPTGKLFSNNYKLITDVIPIYSSSSHHLALKNRYCYHTSYCVSHIEK